MAQPQQHGEHKACQVDAIETETMPSCSLCKRIDASGTLPKRLIVCCDGTNNSSNQGVETNPTNVARLSRAIANVGYASDGSKVPQITYYQAGIGTDPTVTSFTKAKQQGLGIGLNEKVCEAYNYLANNYGPGDEIFIFGFSRGAYTARVLASFLCQFGLLTPGMMDYFDEIFEAYKHRADNEYTFRDMKWSKGFARPGELGLELNSEERITRYECIKKWTHLHITVKAVGVFDTVGSVGLSGKLPQPGQDSDWHSSSLHPNIEHAFHALAIDESRGNFAPTLYYLYDACIKSGTKLKQCWFPGYHGDIGGHASPDGCINSYDLLTFAWMIDQLTQENLLNFSKHQLYYPILKRVHVGPTNDPPSEAPTSVEEAGERRIKWSDGWLQDTNGIWPYYATSFIATRRFWHVRIPGLWHDPKGREVKQSNLCETIHPSVAHRMQQKGSEYQPKGFEKEWKYDKDHKRWIRTVEGKEVCVIPEYELPDFPVKDFDGKDLWSGGLERLLAPEDVMGKEKFAYYKKRLEEEVAHLEQLYG
ncbi:uncharacterized protein CLAFUR5_09246 [Fulvia fulva]|uniref:T6SS Phospholipase effector Tle1-like catalytic domain-containing protein n=1 Tax=Passalora fulva TaxID=5499 RepID=A0A9Q8UTG1_PASFU|nr:uncharacterized protein CLAFUR5_09246 [Fulvia fulva]UJO21747.1 hypothetical protein CLAFUR5_09246 [Fulvia fulva]